MTLQEIVAAVPHGVLEKVAVFCQQADRRKVTLIKDTESRGYRIEYQLAERVATRPSP